MISRAALDVLQPGPFVEVHPDDLGRYGLADGVTVTVRSRRGVIRLEAQASRTAMPGSVFIPFQVLRRATGSVRSPPGMASV
jgi:anaerobic selenocysteine-containing dehydrogenase